MQTDPATNTWRDLIIAAGGQVRGTDNPTSTYQGITDALRRDLDGFIDTQMQFNESSLGCVTTQQETLRLLGRQVDRATRWAVASGAVAVIALGGVIIGWLVR